MRVTPLARRLGSAALVLTLGTGLAACGGSDSSSTESTPASDGASDAADDTAEDGATEDGATEEAAALTELSADEFYGEVLSALKAAETFSFEASTETGGEAMTMAGQARFSDEGVEMTASSTGTDATMDLILLGKTMYMKSPDLGTGDKWLKIDLSDPNSLFGMIGKTVDPEVMFKAMESPKKLELLGTEELDGVETNHYEITVDPQQYLEAMEFPKEMASMLPDELVTQMWVDADNLPRKYSLTMETPAVDGAPAGTTTTEGTYADFGTEVEITEPPASEITEQPGM